MPPLTEAQIDKVFMALVGYPARAADRQVVAVLGATPEVLAEYIWDHWMGEPDDPKLSTVVAQVREILA